MNKNNFRNYQHKALSYVLNNKFYALFLKPGLGKTIVSLTAILELLESFEISKVLIIAPLRVAQNTWPEEIAQWDHVKDLTYKVLAGKSPKVREKIVKEDNSDIHIINRENIPWLIDCVKAGRYKMKASDWPYDYVIIDESSSFKNASSKRFKSLRRMLPAIERITELTGTPTSNGLLDLWSQIYLLDKGERLGKTLTNYREKYFDSDYMGYTWTPKENSEEEILNKIKDISMSISQEDYVDMPERIDNIINVQMNKKTEQLYDKLSKDLLAIINSKGEAIEAVSKGVLAGKLLQLCNGAVYKTSENNKEYEVFHDSKLDALESIVEESGGESILIIYNYNHDRDRIRKKFPTVCDIKDDKNNIKKWNQGKIPIMMLHPGSAGHGLNLQFGGNTIVWFGLNWSLELYQQTNARLERQGQKKTVVVHHIVMENSIDEVVMKALERKNSTQKNILDAVKIQIEKGE